MPESSGKPGATTTPGAALHEPPPAASPNEHGPLLPEVRRSELANGLTLSVLPRPSSRAVVLHLVVRADLETEDDQRLARWAMLAALWGADASERRSDVLGEPDVQATARAVHVSWSVAPERAEQALDWLARSLKKPKLSNFGSSSWRLEREKQERSIDDPAYLAHQLADTVKSAKKPQLWECQAWLRRFLHPARMHLLWVGPTSEASVRTWTTEQLASWNPAPASDTSQKSASARTERATAATNVVRLGDATGRSWAHLRLSFVGPPRGNAPPERQWTHLQWGSRALAGAERLGSIVRDHRGTGLRVEAEAAPDSWSIHIDVAAPAHEAVRLAERLASAVPQWSNEGFSQEELTLAAHHLRAEFRRALQDPKELARRAAWLIEQGWDAQALERELLVMSPEPAEVLATWTSRPLTADGASVSVVGDAKKLEKPLSAWRAVEVFDPKRQLRLVRRLDRDPKASTEVSASAEEASDGSF